MLLFVEISVRLKLIFTKNINNQQLKKLQQVSVKYNMP